MKKLGLLVMPLMAISLLASCGGNANIKEYTVKFYNGEVEFSDLTQTVNYGEKVQRPETPSIGYTFGGWYSDRTLSNVFDFNARVTQEETEIKIYGKFSLDPTTYFVTFKKEGEEDIIKTFDIKHLAVVAPTFTADPGYGRWKTNDDSKFAYSGDTITFSQNELSNWVFTYDGNPLTYTISYDLNGGTLIGDYPTTYNVTQDIKILNNPTLTGFTFNCWCLEPNEASPLPLKNEWKAGDMIGDITLHADYNDGKPLNEHTFDEIVKISKYDNPSMYLDVGGTTSISLNNIDHQVRIIGFKHDELATSTNNNPQYAGITFEFANVITDSNGTVETCWNDKQGGASTNFDFIHTSNLNDCLQLGGNIYKLIPSEWMNVIREVVKSVNTTSSQTSTNYTTKLFPLSYDEAGDGTKSRKSHEGTCYSYYSFDSQNRRKKDKEYWFRSPREGFTYAAWKVDTEGSIDIKEVYRPLAVAPAFCI